MTDIQTWKTASGVTVDKIAALLAEVFTDADKAYKAVPGAADLTDINTGHMIERVTQVFGIKGLGWNFHWQPEDLVFIGSLDSAAPRGTAHLKNAVFSYCLVDQAGTAHWFEIQTSGMNSNAALYAEEGARTSALGAALKGLCFQLPVYKGYLDHHNAQAVATQITAQRAASEKTAGPIPAVPPPDLNEGARPAGDAAAAVPAGDGIPDRLPDGVNVVKFIDRLADKMDLDAFVLPPGSNISGQKLAAQSDARIRWYAYSMRSTNPRTMVLKVLAYRLLQRKNLLQAGDLHPLAG